MFDSFYFEEEQKKYENSFFNDGSYCVIGTGRRLFRRCPRYDDDAYHLPRHESIFVLEQR